MLDHRGKFTPTYEGLYVVKKAFSGGALILADRDRHNFSMPTNCDAVIQYFTWGSLQMQLFFSYIPMQTKKKKRKKKKEKIKFRLKTWNGGLRKRKAKERVQGSLLDWKPKRAV